MQTLDWMSYRSFGASAPMSLRLLAAADAHGAMHSPDGSRKPTDMTRIWFAIQGLLGAVGNVSKILCRSPNNSSRAVFVCGLC
jgi:hypothetical protein